MNISTKNGALPQAAEIAADNSAPGAPTGIRLFKTQLLGSILSAFRLGSGFIRSKYVAVTLGASGVGLLAQGNQLNMLGLTLGSLSMASGVINRVSAAGEDVTRRDKVLATAFSAQLVTSLIITALGMAFAGQIAKATLGSTDEVYKSLAVLAALPLGVIAVGYIQCIFMASGRYDLFMQASMTANILSLIAFVLLVHFYGIQGAFLGIFVTAVTTFTLFCYQVSKVRRLPLIFRLGFDGHEFALLMQFSFVGLFSSALGYGANLMIRREVIASFGMEANGILQVPLALTAYYTPFLTDGLWGKFFPSVSREGDGRASLLSLSAMVRLMVLMQAAAVVLMMTFPEILIRIGYSSSFLRARSLIPIQFAGDFFYFLVFTMSLYFLGAKKLRIYLAAWLTYYALYIAGSFYLLARLGPSAVIVSYATSNLLLSLAGGAWYLLHPALRREEKVLTLLTVLLAGFLVGMQSLVSASEAGVAARLSVPLLAALAAAAALRKPSWRKALLRG